MGIVNNIFKWYLLERYGMIERFMKYPVNAQNEVWDNLVSTAENTVWGIEHNFSQLNDRKEFSQKVPLQNYETLKPYIKRMMHGEKDVLWPGVVEWFSKSSGTTSDKSKFIPVSKENLKKMSYQRILGYLNITLSKQTRKPNICRQKSYYGRFAG
jgi:hypothetical protein